MGETTQNRVKSDNIQCINFSYIYKYIYVCVCVHACVEREENNAPKF